MVNGISGALNAYQQALGRIGGQSPIAETPAASPAAGGFNDMLKSAIEDTANLQKQSEITTVNAIQGKADIQDVVLAVSNAEAALQTVVAVRDTAIKAYQSIIQMPI